MDALKFNLRQEHIVIYDFVSSFHQARTPPAARPRAPGQVWGRPAGAPAAAWERGRAQAGRAGLAQVLTPLQNARCIVRSYPYVPDSAAIATCIAARCGSRSARDRLKAERPAMALP